MTTSPSTPPIIDAVAVLDLLYDWVDSINRHDIRAMLTAQKQLRAECGVSICLMGQRPEAVRK